MTAPRNQTEYLYERFRAELGRDLADLAKEDHLDLDRIAVEALRIGGKEMRRRMWEADLTLRQLVEVCRVLGAEPHVMLRPVPRIVSPSKLLLTPNGEGD